MPKKNDMPPEGARILTVALSQVRPAEEGMLRDLDLDWSPRLAAWLAIGLMGALPAFYLATGLWLRYRRRRA